jgi:hypothetical protein
MPADRLFHKRLGRGQRTCALTDFEYRVWSQYVLSADDFGVMRKSAVQLQADNDNLANRSSTTIHRALKQLCEVGLVVKFDHQLQLYICQLDWQDWQKITYPTRTINPKPPLDIVDRMTDATKELLLVWPGAKAVPSKKDRRTSDKLSENFKSSSEELSSPRAGAYAKRLTANAPVLEVVPEGVQGEPTADVAFARFRDAYPEGRRKGGMLVQQAFLAAIAKAGGASPLMTALDNHLASEQWSNPKLVPGMDVWLNEERWRQSLPEAGAATASMANPKTAGNVPAFQRFINRGRPA